MEIREAIRREARIKRIPTTAIRDEMEDLLQDVRCEVLAWIQEQGEEVDTADLEKQVRNSAQRVVRHWLESRKRTVTLGEIRPDAIVYALSESGELPAWIPAELRDVAQAIIETSEESAAIGEPGSIPYAELCERLKISKGTLANRMKALRAVHIPDKRLSWYSAASEDYRADHPVTEPWYARTGSTPIRLGDIPAMQQRDNDNSDLIRELCPVADGLGNAIWEGLTACLFAVSAPHGQRLDARLLWGENWASCGRLNSL